jgi:hypothetical protein
VLRFVQNLLIGSGVVKVTLVLKIARRIQKLFQGRLRKEGWQPPIQVMGPWTGPYSKHAFIAAADLLDKALAAAVAQESDMHFMSMLFKPSRSLGGLTKSESRSQSKGDLVRALCLLLTWLSGR